MNLRSRSGESKEHRVPSDVLREEGAELLVCSAPCTMFSALQNLNPSGVDEKTFEEGCDMVRFSVKMCHQQMELGRKFAFEHPLGAISWQLPELRDLIHDKRVYVCEFHMCEYGLKAMDDQGRMGPVMKPTRVLTNDAGIAAALSRRCQGNHKHVVLLGGGRASKAAKYADKFLDAIIKGFSVSTCRQLEETLGGLMSVKEEGMCEQHEMNYPEPQE